MIYFLCLINLFFVISTVLDEKQFSDGTNVHITVKDEQWWKLFFDQLRKEFPKIFCLVILTNLGENLI